MEWERPRQTDRPTTQLFGADRTLSVKVSVGVCVVTWLTVSFTGSNHVSFTFWFLSDLFEGVISNDLMDEILSINASNWKRFAYRKQSNQWKQSGKPLETVLFHSHFISRCVYLDFLWRIPLNDWLFWKFVYFR